jgi:K+-sensing histidine kinase KdpD
MQLTDFVCRTGVKTAAEKLWTAPLMDAALGGALSGIVAVVTCLIAGGHTWKNMVPLVFTVVLLIIAAVFGSRAGIVGTLLAALVFAAFLFAPTGSISVTSESARDNLGWMLLIGIAFSFLFAPPTSGLRRH